LKSVVLVRNDSMMSRRNVAAASSSVASICTPQQQCQIVRGATPTGSHAEVSTGPQRQTQGDAKQCSHHELLAQPLKVRWVLQLRDPCSHSGNTTHRQSMRSALE
jgi:hypothetical protein